MSMPLTLKRAIELRYGKYTEGSVAYTYERAIACHNAHIVAYGYYPEEWDKWIEKMSSIRQGFKHRLIEAGYTEYDLMDMTMREMRDAMDEAYPTTITVVESTRSGGCSTHTHVLEKKAA